MRLFHQRCKEAGIIHDNACIFSYLSAFEGKNIPEQLRLFD